MSGRHGFGRQFSLKTLLILVSTAAALLGWFAWKLQKARVQDAAGEEIVAAGGQVAYSNQFRGGVSRLTPYAPKTNFIGDWSRQRLGGDPTRKMVSVTLIDDESAALVAKHELHDLKVVRLDGGASISNAALAHLANCNQLQVLYLERANVTDRGMELIPRHQQLEELWLSSTRITDAGLAAISRLPALRVLDIRDTAISDEGMKRIAALPNLALVYLDSDLLTDEGIKNLHTSRSIVSLWLGEKSSAKLDLAAAAACPSLEQLYLSGSLVTDDRIAALQGKGSIEHLKVQNCTKLTDESLKTLATMPNLKTLGVRSTPFSAQGINQFKLARPECKVW